MKSVFLVLMILGAVVGAGELAYTSYFAGQQAGTAILFARASGAPANEFEIAADALPVRLNLKVYGWREKTVLVPTAKLKIETGQGGSDDTQGMWLSIDAKNDASRATLGFSGATFTHPKIYNLALRCQIPRASA